MNTENHKCGSNREWSKKVKLKYVLMIINIDYVKKNCEIEKEFNEGLV